jgi:hypothetical protein
MLIVSHLLAAAQNGGAWEYLLPDALGSVRQIVDASGNVTLAESYEPYGTVLTSTGTASSIFGYAGEQADTYIKLRFLWARYLLPQPVSSLDTNSSPLIVAHAIIAVLQVVHALLEKREVALRVSVLRHIRIRHLRPMRIVAQPHG